jgi:putative tricarboxylic transport membrane protein
MGRRNFAVQRQPVTEILVCGFIALICVVFFVQAWGLPPGTFEPLGSGPVPLVTAAIIILCCLIIMAGRIRTLSRGGALMPHIRREFMSRSPYGPLVTLGLTIVYVVALDLAVASFGLITFVFLTVLIVALENFKTRSLLPALVVSAIVSFGVEYLFTNVFVVDLPA